MVNKLFTLKSAVLMSALLLQSCGGGEGGEYAGIDRGGEKLSVTGPINGFGSVILNGVRYNTDNAEIFVRGEPADEQQLDVGDYVTVIGYFNEQGEGIATEVHYQPKVTGPIQAIDKMRNRITVLGQVIQLVQDTNYGSSIRPRNIDGFDIEQPISVSGIAGSDGVIRASRVEKVATMESEVAGMVTHLDTDAQTFYLNELKVQYAFASMVTDLREGQPVVVRGALSEPVLGDLSARAFRASNISFNTDYRRLSEIASLEFRGYVAQLKDGRFSIDGVPARISADTIFDGGGVQDLNADDQIRARGYLLNSELQVEYLRFVSTPVMQSFGEIEDIQDAEPDSNDLGIITVGGFTYHVRADTRLVGHSEQRVSFGEISIGEYVYVSAYSEGEKLVAASLAIDNRETYTMSFEIQGKAYDAVLEGSDGRFSILHRHRHIQTSATTRFCEGSAPLTAEEFYTRMVSEGVSVRVRGRLEGDSLIATIAQVSTEYFVNGSMVQSFGFTGDTISGSINQCTETVRATSNE